MNYIDLYLLPVPTIKTEEYVKQAQTFGEIVLEYGALDYREFKGDDLGGGEESFLKLVTIKPGEMLTSAIAEFESREHRDQVMKKVMDDPRIKENMEQPEIADMKRMVFGGFEQFIESKK